MFSDKVQFIYALVNLLKPSFMDSSNAIPSLSFASSVHEPLLYSLILLKNEIVFVPNDYVYSTVTR